MNLRSRLALTTIAATLPMIFALGLLDVGAQQRAAEAELTAMVTRRLTEPAAREQCEARPADFGRPPAAADTHRAPHFAQPAGRLPPDAPASQPSVGGPPPGPPPIRQHREPAAFFAYDASLRSRDPKAPLLDAAEVSVLEPGDVSSQSRFTSQNVRVLLRTPWQGGPCAYVLATGTREPWLGALLPPTRIWLAPVCVLFLAALLSMGPLVRRVRRLTGQVKQLAARDYAGDLRVTGNDEIAELGRAFDAAARTVRAELAQKAEEQQALRDYVANTTHDLMIPLTVLQGHVAALRERAPGGDATMEKSLAGAMQESHYIASLVNNLGVMAKVDRARPVFQPGDVNLNDLVTRVVARHKPIARELGVELEAALPEHALTTTGDVTLLEQAVSNIVYNAVRYNHFGGHVAVVLEESVGGFVLQVIDDGTGLSDTELCRIAERGYRGNQARTRAPAGQGLGLSIAARVAELHGFALGFARSEYGGLGVKLEGPRPLGPPSGFDATS